MITGVLAHEYAALRARFWPYLDGFASRSQGRVTADELDARIVGKEAQLWMAGDFAAVCMTSLGADHVSIDFCSGRERENWQDALVATIAAWGREQGKSWIIISGRPGWSKWARSRGYRAAHIEMVKELNDGR